MTVKLSAYLKHEAMPKVTMGNFPHDYREWWGMAVLVVFVVEFSMCLVGLVMLNAGVCKWL